MAAEPTPYPDQPGSWSRELAATALSPVLALAGPEGRELNDPKDWALSPRTLGAFVSKKNRCAALV